MDISIAYAEEPNSDVQIQRVTLNVNPIAIDILLDQISAALLCKFHPEAMPSLYKTDCPKI